jgi:hypothetical protein
MTDVFATPDDDGTQIRASDLHTSLGEQTFAEAQNALDPSDWLSGIGIARAVRMGAAGGYLPHDYDGLPGQAGITLSQMDEQARAEIPALPIDQAQQRVKDAGLEGHVHLPAQAEIKQPVLDLMIQEGQERRDREAAIGRGPQGFYPDALGVVTSIGAGMLDPVNAAAFSIPLVGEARWGKIVESAGDSILNRAALNAGRGAVQGAAGTAALQPAEYWLRTRDGQDYTFTDALKAITLGAGMGGVAHAGFGVFGDVMARRRGLPLPGSPQDLLARGQLAGVHVPAEALDEGGTTADLIAEILGEPSTPQRMGEPEQIHPAELYGDLPPAAQQDALRATMADMINGQLPQTAEMLEVAADHSPRIAESFDAYHGSPHDFDRFDASKIGTGEGAQAYGHGLYFAENEDVARGYQRTTSDKAFVNKVAELYDDGFSPGDAWDEIKDHWSEFSPSEQRLMTALEQDDWLGFDYPHQAVNAAVRSIKRYDASPETVAAARDIGNIYRVRIKAPPEHFLDWDKPLSEQSDFVRKALLEHPDPGVAGTAEKWGHDVQNLYRRLGYRVGPKEIDATLGREAAASTALREAGIAGIKYLDQHSRDSGDGTRNFVVFNDKDVEITHKNGEPLKKEEFLADQARHVAANKPRGRAAADPKTWSLFETLAHEGGLRPDPELEAIFGSKKGPFVPGFGALVRPGGRTLDDALRLAKDHGYLFDAADVTGDEARLTPRDLLDRLAEENAGRRQYQHDQALSTKGEQRGADERETHEIITHLHDQLESASGMPHTAIDPRLENRVVEIMTREGERDVLAAFERAIMEDAERYDGLTDARENTASIAHIPGWDADEPAAAPGHGATDLGQRGPAGFPGSGRGAADGGQSRDAGRGDRTAAEAALARDQAFARLGNRLPAYDAPEEVENSRWADNLPEPASVDPSKSAAALQQAVDEAEQIWRDLEPYLSDEERRVFNDALEAVDRDAAANAQVLKDGAACLAAAVTEGAV